MRIGHRRLITAGKRSARVAGGVYLLVVFGVAVARVAVRFGAKVPGIPAPATSTKVRGALMDDIALAAAFAFVGGAVYLLLRQLDRHAAGRAMVYVAVAGGMITINLLVQRAVIATGPLSGTGGPRSSGGLVALLLNMHGQGYAIAAIVICLWLVALAHLAYRSARFPIAVSVVLTVSLIAATVVRFAWPGLPTVVHAALAPPAVVDLWLIAYLVIKGRIRVPANSVRPAAAAA
jgi:Domain of unknown function (DUF4386)